MLKRTIALISASALLFCLFSCGNNKKGDETDTQPATDDRNVSGMSVAEGLEYDYPDLEEYIELCDYTSLKVEDYNTVMYAEESTDNAIDKMLDENGKATDVTGSASEGDTVYFSGTGKIAGNSGTFKIEDGASVKLGSGEKNGFPKGFDTQLIGVKAGDGKKFSVEYPDDYIYTDFAGKSVEFDLKITSVRNIIPAELTDELVASLGIDGVTTVDEYRAHVESTIKSETNEQNKRNKQDAIYQILLAECSVIKYPEKELNTYLDQEDKEAASYAQAYAQSIDDYKVKNYGSIEKYEEQKLKKAQDSVKEDLIIYAIARKLNITVGADEYREMLEYGYDMMSQQTGMSFEDFEKAYSDVVTRALLIDNTLAALADMN